MIRIDRLLAEMRLEEKLGQLTMLATGSAVTGPTSAGAVTEQVRAGGAGHVLNLVGRAALTELQRAAVEESRLGVPLLFALDVLHGYRTLFPIPLAEAGIFDPSVWEWTARAAAREAAADALAMTFAPMLDVARDPRWGRCAEGPGEDPLVAARFAAAKIRGFQAAHVRGALRLAAVAKHFCAYGAATAGLDYASVDVSDRTLREVYLPPFAAAVAAGAAAVMPAFNDIAGEPMTSHAGLLRGWLRKSQGFGGLIVSDYHAIAELITHGVAADEAHAATLALRAGVDVDMMSDAYRRGLPLALERGWVALADIDAAVRRVLELKQRLGLFEDPYRERAVARPPRARKRAREIATRALVLLKNAGDVLPLDPPPRTLALLGPLADARAEMRGPWWGAAEPEDAVSVYEGLRRALPGSTVLHAPCVALAEGGLSGMPAGLALVERADAIVLCLGEGAEMSGEAASRAALGLPGRQDALAEAVLERAGARGVPVIVVLFSGRPLVVPELIERADAVIAAWFLGCEAGNAIADVLSGRASPSGRSAISWPRAIGQIPIFFAQRPGGRPGDARERFTSRYLDLPAEPLFPFGHGLGYGRCRLERLRLGALRMRLEDTLEIHVEVVHEAGRAVEETVFLFTHALLASVTRPALELRDFARIRLEPGESATLTLTLRGAALRFPGPDLEPTFAAGPLEILVGPCADRARLLVATIELVA